jgi:multiple sugar transport system substrate-binding protein
MARDPVPLRGLTWAHPRGFDSLVACNDDLERDLGVTVDWEARSLLDFGDRPIHEFSHKFDLMIVDHPHIAAAVSEGSLVALDQHLLPGDLEAFRVESAGRSHESYSYQGHQWALAVDAAAQVTAVRPDLITDLPLRWSDALELAEQGRALWAHKPVDAFSTYATVCAQLGAPIDDYQRFAPAVSDETLELLRQIAEACPEWCADANPIDVAEAMTATDEFSIGISMFG